MAKENSFDIVSRVDLQEVTNAVDQTIREISTRYDFRQSPAEIEWDRKKEIKIVAENEYRLEAALEVLKAKMGRRNVPIRSLGLGKVESAAGGKVRQTIEVKQGIPTDKAREIVAAIKELKLKVQAQIMDDQVRVSGKSKDELQKVIQALRERDFGIELQFVNYR